MNTLRAEPSPRRTRIIATLGPATSEVERLSQMIEAGVNVFRLNFSHGDADSHRETMERIHTATRNSGRDVGVLQDLQGPKLRLRKFAQSQVTLAEGQPFELRGDGAQPGDADGVGISYARLAGDVEKGQRILLDDGRIQLEVVGVQGSTIDTRVMVGGVVSNHKGINVPGANLAIPALTDKDIADLETGVELGVDWVALSFVRSRDDIKLARHYMERYGSKAHLMAKIEKPGAVREFDAILEATDGVMIARGDLGVELSPQALPALQKSLIRRCRAAGKPVVTATEMLNSMVNSPRPSRADASDVANAIYDGTDAVMLSAETAIGEYPVETVAMMSSIAHAVEGDEAYRDSMRRTAPESNHTTADAVAKAACEMARDVKAAVIVSFSSSGSTALRVSRQRPPVPVLALTPSARSLRRLTVSWGVIPSLLGSEISNSDEMVHEANRHVLETGLADVGDRYVVIAGVPFGISGTTNLIRVEKVRKE